MSFADVAWLAAASLLATGCSGNLHHTFAEFDAAGDSASDGRLPLPDTRSDTSAGANDAEMREGASGVDGAVDVGGFSDTSLDVASPDVPLGDTRAPDGVDAALPDAQPDVPQADTRDGGADVNLDVSVDAPVDAPADTPVDRPADAPIDAGCTDPLTCTPAAPHLLSPHSTGRVTSRQPILKWAPASVASHYLVDLCNDAACSSIIQTIDTVTTTAQPTSLLPIRSVVYWRVRAVNDSFSTPSATWEFFIGAGSGGPNTSWLGPPDLNRDGRRDVAFGGAGQIFVLMHQNGLPNGLSPITGSTDFGHSISYAGDVNGDGYGEIIAAGLSNAAATMYMGSATGIDVGAPVAVLAGAPGTSGFRQFVAGIGDINGDGYADLAVGMGGPPFTWNLIRGSATGPESFKTTFDSCGDDTDYNANGIIEGCPAGGAGDVNGDGYADVIVCSRAAKQARVYLGDATGIGASTTLTLPAPGSTFGDACIGAGDVNGDGYSDVMVASKGIGFVYVYYGSATGVNVNTYTTLTASSSPGAGMESHAIAAAGDVNSDGFGDIIVGAYDTGIVYVFHGSASGIISAPASTFMMFPLAEGYSAGVGAAGDVDGDGYDDILMTPRPCATGNVLLYSGSSTGVVPIAQPAKSWVQPSGGCVSRVAR